jgi:DNA topoisomerase-1
MTRLFVIEAPKKARTFETFLRDLGENAKVQATVGHLFEFPPMRGAVGIDRAFRDFERKPIRIDVVERLRLEASLCSEVIVATDADSEGETIAWDVATLLADIHPEPKRMLMRGMDRESVREALANLTPVSRDAAIPGRTRAIIDRLIGVGYSKNGIAVGRVSTARLGLVAQKGPGTHMLRLSAPAKDRGRPYLAECDVSGPMTLDLARRLEILDLPALDMRSRDKAPSTPGHTGDILVAASHQLDIPPIQVADAMQRNYEAGKLSYPRAGERSFSPMVAAKFADILRKAGYPAVKAANYPVKPPEGVHDAPHPIGKVDLASDPRELGHDEGVRAIVARGLVRAGQERITERPQTAPLGAFLLQQGFPQAVAVHVMGLDWRRDVGPRCPGQEAWPVSEVVERRADAVLLERAVEIGLGRPSTWGKHIEKFMERGLVDADLALTAKGEAWKAASPVALLDPRVSVAIESACERCPGRLLTDPDREPWELNAERIFKALPPDVRGVLGALVENEPPRPKLDPIRAYGLDRSFAAEAAAAAGHEPGYAPADA